MADDKKKSPKKKKKMGIFPLFLLLIFFASLGACAYLVYEEVDKEMSIMDMEDDIQMYMKPSEPAPVESTKTPETDDGESTDTAKESVTPKDPEYIFDWDGMLEQSEYVIGWIQIPGIDRINYPIVQHPEDNQFFLTHDWKGAYQSAGAIFMNKNNASDFTDMNTIIYGHRMKAGSMFGLLKNYKDQVFMDEHPTFFIYTPDGQKLTYEVICYSSVTDGSDAYLMHFESPDERMAYYNMMLYNAATKRDVELGRFDSTVMLSTCNGTGYYDRVVILGKLVEIDPDGQIAE